MTGPRNIVIVGRDAALWLTATALRQTLESIGVKVTAVELPSKLGPASAYTTLPALEALHSKLGIDEAQLLRATCGSFSLGWNILPPGSPAFMLAHGSYGAAIDGSDFFAYWQKARRFGLDVALENFSPTAMAARHGRILVPDEDTESFGRTDYAYHLPAIAYCSMLKARAHRLGVTIHQTLGVGIERDGIGDEIRAVAIDGGRTVEGDLFIDSSGPEAELIGVSIGTAAEDWRLHFPLNRVLTGKAQRRATVPTYSELRLRPDGWTALHAGPASTHVVHAYIDVGSGAETAVARASEAAGAALSDVAVGNCEPALRSQAWAANCVAIGAAACSFDPLFDLELYAVQLGIVHLLSLFPATLLMGAERFEFNRITRSHFERLRDFQSALYVLAGIAPAAPSSLQQKFDAFEARGAIAPMEDETFSSDQWRALFVGLGLTPETWPPAIDKTSAERMKEDFRRILAFVHDKVLEQPGHEEYLANFGAGPE